MALLATYTYDYKGRRSRKVLAGTWPLSYRTTIYVYDVYDRLVGELNGAGRAQLTYVWRDDIPVSIIDNASETVLYLETDHLNTPIAARNQAGTVVWKWEPDAFGGMPPNEDADGDGIATTINLRFPGQYYDKESGLHYNWRRYYDPKIGRYMSPDPIGLAGGPNPYSYVENNPLGDTDPLGLMGGGGNHAHRNPVYNPPGPNHCVTAECAAGLLPAPLDLRPQSEVDKGQCKLVCQMVSTPPVAACNMALGGGLAGMVGGAVAKAGFCSLICN